MDAFYLQWIGFDVMSDPPGLIFMQMAFAATSLLGIYRWMLVKPGFRTRKQEG